MNVAMEAEKLQAKIFLQDTIALEALVPVFYDWIKYHRLSELLVDVANYLHVPHSPGVGIIGHEANYFVGEGDDRPGLLYSRKRLAPAPEERIRDTFRRAVNAALLLEQEPALGGKVRFHTGELLFRINDRLLAPSGDDTFAAVRPELEAFCSDVFGAGEYELALASSPRQLFAVTITSRRPIPLPVLLKKLGGPAA